MHDGRADGSYEDFITGFVTKDGQVWGLPVGVADANEAACLSRTTVPALAARFLRRQINEFIESGSFCGGAVEGIDHPLVSLEP